ISAELLHACPRKFAENRVLAKDLEGVDRSSHRLSRLCAGPLRCPKRYPALAHDTSPLGATPQGDANRTVTRQTTYPLPVHWLKAISRFSLIKFARLQQGQVSSSFLPAMRVSPSCQSLRPIVGLRQF